MPSVAEIGSEAFFHRSRMWRSRPAPSDLQQDDAGGAGILRDGLHRIVPPRRIDRGVEQRLGSVVKGNARASHGFAARKNT
jgi:hypothetical protein